ncbi:MAG: DNA polymerase III subunit alpha [Clostridia bacterium]|nr:DNA polymerase III subunit alpha [Clostridia bacterium]
MNRPPFVHLHVHSYFSFLDGASSPEELVRRAAELGMPALALTDHDNVSGAVRFARAARAAGIQPIQGAEVTLEGGYHLTLLATGPAGYARLCRLLSEAHLNHPRGRPRVRWQDLEAHRQGLIALSGCRRGEIARRLLRRDFAGALEAARRYRLLWGERFYLEVQESLLPGDRFLNRHLQELGERLGIPLVATHDVHYATREGFRTHDLLSCVRLGIPVEEAHPERPLNDDLSLHDPAVMARRFAWAPEALEHAWEIARLCQPALDPARRRYPRFPVPEGESADGYLHRLALAGARERYGRLTPAVRERLERELRVVERLGYADYFLTAWQVVEDARREGIRHSGRGSAGASALAYCLRLTEVDPIARNLPFERFLSLERAEKPDIDLDFDARYRDRVAERVIARYGQEHVAAVATYVTYQARSAVRDMGKVLGYPAEEVDALAKSLPHLPADAIPEALERFPELRRGPWREERYRPLLEASARLAGLPRFLGTHLGGLVISGEPVREVTPLQWAAKGVQIAQFDRDDVEELNLVKVDLLSLKALSLLEDAAADLLRKRPGFRYEALPLDDPATYRLLRKGQTVGVFQLESPAQRALQARLGAERLEDVVASLALIRPGPIKGNMVDPYVARRQGREPVTFPHPALAPILEKTYGVVLFQEQVIAIATELAGFTPGEADRLRRLMTHARSRQEMRAMGEEFVRRAVARGVGEATARQVFASLEGYASYGFCEAHAAAFATTSYWTAYLSAHHPAHFFAALLNNQPMGFYAPATLVNEARNRGVRFLGLDVNRSGERFAVEGRDGREAIRIPLARVKGIRQAELGSILEARRAAPFTSFADFRRRTRVERDTLERLILAGAFDALHPNRRALLAWLPPAAGPSGPAGVQQPLAIEPAEAGPDFTPEERLLLEYQVLGMSAQGHPMHLWRDRLRREGYLSRRELERVADGRLVRVAGLPVRPHRPPTRSGRTVVFLSLEDETGLTDVTVFEGTYQRYGHLLFGPETPPLRVVGRLQRRGLGLAVVAEWIGELRADGLSPRTAAGTARERGLPAR